MPNSYGSWRTGIQIDNIYPVGSIYMSINSTNPHDLFGGSWEQINNTFLVAQGTSYSPGSTGGSASSTHTHNIAAGTSGSTILTIAQTPAHTHTRGTMEITGAFYGDEVSRDVGITGTGAFQIRGGGTGGFMGSGFKYTLSNGFNFAASRSWTGETSSVGEGEGHTHSTPATTTSEASNTNNLPPYLAVYMWKRIA